MGNRGKICRVCFQECAENFENIEGNVKEALKFLLPKINLAGSAAPVMCTNCTKTLETCFDFKWTCLCRHRSVVSCVNSKDNVNGNLKYLHLIKEENQNTNSIMDHNTCGLCTMPSNSCSIVSPDMEEVKMMLRECVPELVLNIINICAPCHESLASCFHFITKCSNIEEKIQKNGGNSSINDEGITELNHPSRVPIQLRQIFCTNEADSGKKVAHRDGIFVDMDQNCHYLKQLTSEDMSSCQEEDNTADVIKEEKFLEETGHNVKQESENFVKKEDQDFNNKEQVTPEILLVLEEESNKLDMVKMEEIFFEKEDNEVEYESDCIEMEEQKSKNLQLTPKISSMMIHHNQIGMIKPDKTLYEGSEAANDKIELKHENYFENEDQKFNNLAHFTSNNILTCGEDCTKFEISKIEEIYSEKGDNNAENGNNYLTTMDAQKYDLNEEVDIKLDLQNSNRFEDDIVLPELEADPTKPCINCMSTRKAISGTKSRKCEIVCKDPSDVAMYKYDSCSYQTMRKDDPRPHLPEPKGPLEVTIYKCDSCSFQTKCKISLKAHEVTHEVRSGVSMYNCDFCSFQSNRKWNFNNHLLTHKDPLELTMYKCDFCLFETKYKRYLKYHLLTHKDPSELIMHKCEFCSFQTRSKIYLRSHLLRHKDLSDVNMYGCDSCLYLTKRKSSLISHMLIHKDPSDVTMYNCNFCSFQTKRKSDVSKHLLTHRDPSEVPMFKCDSCSYQSKRNGSLKRHMMMHKSPSEVTMFKCESCSYQSKDKGNLKQHLMLHKNTSEIPVYNCDFCSFQTRRKSNLKVHFLIHKDASDVTLYNCNFCLFQAKRKSDLNKHLLTHKDPSEVPMFKCDSCSYQTKQNGSLKRHLKLHKTPLEVTMYKCDSCSFQTK